MTALTLLPAILLMMTAFTRIVIVLAILRQAIGAGQTPPNQVLVGLALFLTLLRDGAGDRQGEHRSRAALSSPARSRPRSRSSAPSVPLKEFMLEQTRETRHRHLRAHLRRQGLRQARRTCRCRILVPAFVTSELKTAFQIGFLIFIPFVIIDLVVASVLMSMGMMMLSPVLISLPFKIMLFVLVDGWSLVMGTLAASFFR